MSVGNETITIKMKTDNSQDLMVVNRNSYLDETFENRNEILRAIICIIFNYPV